MKVEKLILEGRGVRLEPLSREHAAGLAAAITDGDLHMLPVTKIPHPGQLDAFFVDADEAFAAGGELAFATIDKQRGAIAGSTRFRNIDTGHKRVEIGFTFLGRSWQRTHVNTEAKYLMLKHAFEVWGVNRVELLTDVLNAASRAAIARIGGKQEGILRSHMVMRDGRIRDSVIFSIVKSEWPQVKAMLEKKLASANTRIAPAQAEMTMLKASLTTLLNDISCRVSARWPMDERVVHAMSHGSMTVELYAPAEHDPQTPHDQDELYFVMRGASDFVLENRRAHLRAGDVIFVPAGAVHRFENFSDDFATWVVFYGEHGGER